MSNNIEKTNIHRKSSLYVYEPEQDWIKNITSKHFGINQRIKKLLEEFNHLHYKQEIVSENIREIALNDLWFYKSIPEANKAIGFIISLFQKLLNKGLDCQYKKRFLNTLLEFIKELYSKDSEEIDYDFISNKLILLLKENILNDKELRIYASSFFKKIPVEVFRNNLNFNSLENLKKETLQENLNLWQKNLNFKEWWKGKGNNLFKKYNNTIHRISEAEKQLVNETQQRLAKSKTWEELSNVYAFDDFIDSLNIFKKMNNSSIELINFVSYLLEMPEIFGLRDNLLKELAYSLKEFKLEKLKEIDISFFLNNLFSIIDQVKYKNMEKTIAVLLSLGKKIYQTESKNNIDIFNQYLIDFGFIFPGKVKINQDWQIEINRDHINMIRLWFELIKYSPKHSTKLIKALIVNLKIGGIFIRDNDLFQRDISQLLASDIKPNYFLIKHLVSLFPVYYNDIGAEGEIRKISTEIDKLSYNSDSLIHFLRKQVHSESNNTQIDLIKKIFYFWYDGNATYLKKLLPEDVQNKLKVKGKWFEPVHEIIIKLCNEMDIGPEILLEKPINEIKTYIEKINTNDTVNIKRMLYLIELFQLLKHKYSLGFKYLINDLKKLKFFSEKEIKHLENNINSKSYAIAIKKIYIMLAQLKKIILAKEKTETNENIYYKRHIASGIPSMYGRYSEKRFEAMGLILRLEKMANYLINKYINQRNLNYMTIDGFHNAAKILKLFKEGLNIDDISNENFSSNLEMLNYSFKTTTFSMAQFVNIFYFLTLNIKEIIDSNYIIPFNTSLKIIIQQQIKENNSIKIESQKEHFVYRKSEEFYRNMIVSAFLIQDLDNYVSRILATLRSMMDKLKPDVITMLLNYNPKLIITSFHQKNPKVDNQTFLGAKAYYLKKLYSYKFPIPNGFILTTEWFRERTAISQFPEMNNVILAMIKDKIGELEKITRKKFGDPDNPLLLAVRSGTVIPMPGAMDSILNIGMNDTVAQRLSENKKYGWAAWDSYRRLLQQWGMAHGINRDEFDKIILNFKNLYKVEEKKFFTKEQMKSIAFSYKDLLLKKGIELEENPFRQLIQAIIFVFKSWYNDRAKLFRKKLQIAEEWGTAAIIQEMVLGNISDESGTGVIFTKIPFEKSSDVAIYGDFTQRSQGEDIVSGLVYALPVSEFQNRKFPRLKGNSLEKKFPEIYRELLNLAQELVYKRGYEHQEIEFTFKSEKKEDLYILQTRQYSIKNKEKTPVFRDPAINGNLTGTGIGIGKGAINGIVAFNMKDLKMLSRKFPNKNKILIRPDTVPDDIEMIFECDGLLTARGGVASHAAVTAAQLGKICIVNCKQLIVFESEGRCIINDSQFKTGDKIAIDSNLGNIYKGNHPITMEKINYL